MRTLTVRIDGVVATPLYCVSNGDIKTFPVQNRTSGPHVLTISVQDTVGNQQTVSNGFTVQRTSAIYLPMVRRSRTTVLISIFDR